MRQFLFTYWNYLKVLPKNLFLYLFIFLILSGGHTPVGKVVAIIALFIIVPLFQMWASSLQKRLRNKDDKG